MPDPTPESVACPTCGAGVGDRCGAYGTLYVETHPPRIALSQSRPPNPEWERFADDCDAMAEVEEYPISIALHRVASAARRIARGRK